MLVAVGSETSPTDRFMGHESKSVQAGKCWNEAIRWRPEKLET